MTIVTTIIPAEAVGHATRMAFSVLAGNAVSLMAIPAGATVISCEDQEDGSIKVVYFTPSPFDVTFNIATKEEFS